MKYVSDNKKTINKLFLKMLPLQGSSSITGIIVPAITMKEKYAKTNQHISE